VYEQLGVGGMATVHVAETRIGGTRRRVALKRLLEHWSSNEELLALFNDEARLAQYLHHANLAETYDVGYVEDTYYIAMELVQGPTVGQLLRQCKSTFGVIPFPISMNLLGQLCDALHYAHNLTDPNGNPLGIIHRDVTPPNVVISNSGIVKLIDFGLAKARSAHTQTNVGTVKGKFSYIAPEYLQGRLDSRCDLWSVGALAYELLTGSVLFDAATDLAVLEHVRSLPISPPSQLNPEVPPELDAIVMTALERDPTRRWQSAGALANALRTAAADMQTVVSNTQLGQWVQWAFEQEPPEARSELSQLIALLETPSRPSGRGSQSFDRGTPARQPVQPVNVAALPPPPSPTMPIAPRRGGAVLGMILLLTVLAGGAAALWYFGLWTDVAQSL
jgi:eukaryotic-like serine/threonine-protein kinase